MLSKEEIQLKDKLNSELGKYGLSLDSTINDCYTIYLHPIKDKKKIPPLLTPLSQKQKTLRQYVDDVKNSPLYNPEKTITELTIELSRSDNFYYPICRQAYQNAEKGVTLTLFETYFDNENIVWRNSFLIPIQDFHTHIEYCLSYLMYGVEIAYIISEIQNRNAGNDLQQKISELPNDRLAIFNVSKFNNFRNLEQTLFNRNYFNENRQWQTGAKDLVAMILVLTDNRYFRNASTKKQIKDFFQGLYQIDIKQQWEPARRDKISQSDKQIFQRIIDNIH